MSRRGRSGPAISLFSFQDIITSVTAIVTVIALLLALDLVQRKQSQSSDSSAAMAVILFIYGWNQYLWPLLVINDRSMETIVVGLAKMIGNGDSQNEWNTIMATAVLAMTPPVLVVVFMQRWFIKGLTETEK